MPKMFPEVFSFVSDKLQTGHIVSTQASKQMHVFLLAI